MVATERSRELAHIAAQAAADIKATDLVALDVSENLALTDIFVIGSGSNERQVDAIVDAVEEAMLKQGVKALRREGKGKGRWVLLDFGDIIAHVQHEEDRAYYALERLWKDCPVVELSLSDDEATSDSAPESESAEATQ